MRAALRRSLPTSQEIGSPRRRVHDQRSSLRQMRGWSPPDRDRVPLFAQTLPASRSNLQQAFFIVPRSSTRPHHLRQLLIKALLCPHAHQNDNMAPRRVLIGAGARTFAFEPRRGVRPPPGDTASGDPHAARWVALMPASSLRIRAIAREGEISSRRTPPFSMVAARRSRARLTRLLIVPTGHPQMCAASS